MSWSVYSPMFPSLTPRLTDPLWFTVDKPVDEETELSREEAEQTQALEKISKQGSDLTPIGKNGNDQIEDNEEEEDEDEGNQSCPVLFSPHFLTETFSHQTVRATMRMRTRRMLIPGTRRITSTKTKPTCS